MGYVDLRRRQEERTRDHRANAAFWHDIGHDPYFFSTLGFGLTTPASWVPFFMFMSDAPLPVVALPLFPSTALVLLGLWQLQRRKPRDANPGPGGEKQLLVAIQKVDSITPIEAALETSLTVDEAEEILSRLADRGHLRVESRDGALLRAARQAIRQPLGRHRASQPPSTGMVAPCT